MKTNKLGLIEDLQVLEDLLFRVPANQVTKTIEATGGKLSVCRHCGESKGWLVDPAPNVDQHAPRLSSLKSTSDGKVAMHGGHHLPVYRYSCINCGNMLIFNAYVVISRGISLGTIEIEPHE